MKNIPDIDIDFYDRDTALEHVKCVTASMLKDKELIKHNVGIYLQDIPVDPFTGFSSIPYKEAEQRYYFKFDFLNISIYKDVQSEQHLDLLISTEPDWKMLCDKTVVEGLFQLGDHFDITCQMSPTSVEELAMLIAMIRPAKRHLIGKSWDDIRKEIWVKPTEGYYFKKSHSISYAIAIVVQMNLISGIKLS